MGRKNTSKSKSSSRKKKAKPSSPPPRTGHLLVSDNAGTIVVCGGYNDESPGLMDVWIHTALDGWTCVHDPSSVSDATSSSPTPLSRSMAAGCMVGGHVYLFGGMQREGSQLLVYNDLWEFDLASRHWRCLVEEVTGVSERSGAGMVALPDGRLLLHGGECLGTSFGDCFVTSLPVTDPSFGDCFAPLPTASSSTLPTASSSPPSSPCPRASHSLVLCVAHSSSATASHCLVLFGGTTTLEDGDTLYHNDVWTLAVPPCNGSSYGGSNEEGGEWKWSAAASSSTLAPSPRSLCAAASICIEAGVGEDLDRLSLSGTKTETTAHSFQESVLFFGGFGLVENNECDVESDGEKDDEKEATVISVGSNAEVSTSDVTVELQKPDALNKSALSVIERQPKQQRSNEEKESSARSIVDSEKLGREDEEDDEGSIAEGYLSDCWLLNVRSGRFSEVILPLPLQARGGCSFAFQGAGAGGGQEAMVFGGFDGEGYAGLLGSFNTNHIELID